MKKYTTIIFDLDGTLLDTLEDLKEAVNYALEDAGYPVRSTEEIRCFVGNGIRNLIERAVPNGTSVEDTDRVFEKFKEYYNKYATQKTVPYPGIVDMLKKLKNDGYNIAIITNKVQSAVDVLQKKFFYDTIKVAVGDKQGQLRKPSPDTTQYVMDYFSASKDETLFVGDSEVDIYTARNAEVDYVCVSWGFRTPEELLRAGAIDIVDNVEELLKKIN